MLQGIQEVQSALNDRGIQMVIGIESPESGALRLAKHASLVVCDCGYLSFQRSWRRWVADRAACPVIQVESDVIVPVREASPKEEYTAATFRPKIRKQLPAYLIKLKHNQARLSSLNLELETTDIRDLSKALSNLDIDRSVLPVAGFKGGTQEARQRLNEFIKNNLFSYREKRNDPNAGVLSGLSPYLHFGQISPLEVSLEVAKTGLAGADAFLEELIVRRELSVNYCFYNPAYSSFEGLPAWAKKTLQEHRKDQRQYIYSLDEFESASTHDEYWNAAQLEMVATGKMHGYMRMYWGKKILEWSDSPEEAFRKALLLNNRYELDGRDPNGYAGVAWCLGKHDRPWSTRPIFGNVRFLSAGGLNRKFDIDSYVSRYS
jgi:deoxyribodipyrimidine photo-lyase